MRGKQHAKRSAERNAEQNAEQPQRAAFGVPSSIHAERSASRAGPFGSAPRPSGQGAATHMPPLTALGSILAGARGGRRRVLSASQHGAARRTRGSKGGDQCRARARAVRRSRLP
eukprot:7163441-Prymnesium_polylepis.1